MVAAPCLLVLSLLLEQNQWSALRTAGWLELGAPAYSAVGASIIGHGVVYYLLGRYPVSVTAPIMLLTPVIAIVFGVTLWGDELTGKLVLGGVLTIMGVAIINVRNWKVGLKAIVKTSRSASQPSN